MYDSFFGFKRPPFSAVVDWRCCAAIPAFRDAYDEITGCLTSGRGIAVLTGPAGTGKSLLCQLISEELAGDFRTVLLTSGGLADRSALLQAVLFELGQPFLGLSEQELRLQFTAAVRDLGGNNSALVLLVDEAHTVCESALDELRGLANLVAKGQPLVRILLCGQFPLEEKLAAPSLESLNQRIGCHTTLEPLTRAESATYMDYRIKQAGGVLKSVFTTDAVQTITFAADGNPRCINQLCDRSLSIAAQYTVRPVPDSIVRRALTDLKQLPLHWNDPPPAKAHDDLDDLDDTIPILAPEPEEQESLPQQVALEKHIAFEPEPQNDAAVVEFGVDVAPVTASKPTKDVKPSKPAATVEFGADVFEPELPRKPAAKPQVKMPTGHDLGDTEWTAVDTRVGESTGAIPESESPEIAFGKSVANGMLRALSRQNQGKLPESAESGLEDITINDHYAALLNEQRKPREIRPVPVVKEPPKKPTAQSETDTYAIAGSPIIEDSPSRLLQDDDLQSEPDVLIDSVIKAVQQVADEKPPNRPVRNSTREIDAQRFGPSDASTFPSVPLPTEKPRDEIQTNETIPSLEKLLREVEFDIVRPMEDEEPETHAANGTREANPSSADSPRPYIDLFTRLRRLQKAE